MRQEKLLIRKAKLKDRDELEKLWDRVIQDAFIKEGTDEYHNPKDELAFKMEQFDAALKELSSHYFCAFVDDKLVGTIAYGTPPNRGILRRTGDELKEMVEIGSLYIEPTLQKKGYGRRLLMFILEDLLNKGIHTVCFDSIIESSKQIWRKIFGEPKYQIPSKKHEFVHMIWVVNVKESLENIKKRH